MLETVVVCTEHAITSNTLDNWPQTTIILIHGGLCAGLQNHNGNHNIRGYYVPNTIPT